MYSQGIKLSEAIAEFARLNEKDENESTSGCLILILLPIFLSVSSPTDTLTHSYYTTPVASVTHLFASPSMLCFTQNGKKCQKTKTNFLHEKVKEEVTNFMFMEVISYSFFSFTS